MSSASERVFCDRILKSAVDLDDGDLLLALLSCELGFARVNGFRALLIRCPNAFVANAIAPRMTRTWGYRLSGLGLQHLLLAEDSSYCWYAREGRHSFTFVGPAFPEGGSFWGLRL